MDALVFALVMVGIPASIMATIFRLLSVEFALGFVWAVLLLTVALGLWMMWHPDDTEGLSQPR